MDKSNASKIFRNKCKYDKTDSVRKVGEDLYVVGDRFACRWRDLTTAQKAIVEKQEQEKDKEKQISQPEETKNSQPTQQQLEDFWYNR